jgi:hypothetical protein
MAVAGRIAMGLGISAVKTTVTMMTLVLSTAAAGDAGLLGTKTRPSAVVITF